MIHIYIGGEEVDPSNIRLKNNDFIIGVDRGSLSWLKLGIYPDLCIGDFDSISDDTYQRLKKIAKVIKLPAEKDLTDTEAALKYVLEMQLRGDILIYGFTGGRLDHLMSCLWLGFHPKFSQAIERIHFVANDNRLSFLKPGRHIVQNKRQWKYLSFISYTPVTNLSLTGVKYSLKNKCLRQPIALISNEFNQKEVVVEFEAGLIAMIMTNDSLIKKTS